MYARLSRFRENPDRIDEGTRLAEEKIVPQLESVPGFLGVISLVNREAGETVSVTFWDSEDAMRASEEAANRMREEAADLAEGEIRGVERYEVALRVGV